MLIAILMFMASHVASVHAQIPRQSVHWDDKSLIFDGKRVVPVMGEVHYSRIPQDEWAAEVRKMKEGGVTIVATYVFWNHVEEVEGIYNWSGQRNLRAFLEVCKQQDMPVVLRLGPFCHGEVRNGGIPDWMFAKGCKMREENHTFLTHAERLYAQIFTQVQGLQWKDGGPVIAAQFDNEYRGKGSYLMALKEIALRVGFDLPFYTRTGWPELRTPVPYGEMIPLYGDYADGFWDRSLEPAAGNYYKAFNFKAFRSSTAIATEQLGAQKEQVAEGEGQYPYFTCELGGGMMTAYHRRPYIYPEDAYSMAVVKLGSGSNLLGYYMYHGGTNPEALMSGGCDDGKYLYLNENQRTFATNYNDMPVKTYDFQAPLGEFGQPNPHYYMLRKLHMFMHDYAEVLAPMRAVFPCPQDITKGDDSHLRWSYRAEDKSGFVFVNNYERLQQLTAKTNVRFSVGDVTFPQKSISVPAGAMFIFPVNIDGIKYATAQIVAKRDGNIYLEKIPGISAEICVDGKILRDVKPKGVGRPVYKNLYLLDSHAAERLFMNDEGHNDVAYEVKVKKLCEAACDRIVSIGVQKVAEEPTDDDFKHAAVYEISIPMLDGMRDDMSSSDKITHSEKVSGNYAHDDASSMDIRRGKLLSICYRGDCARLYVDGKFVADNFYNGRPFLMGLWRLPESCSKLELRILPLQKSMPVYFPKEADVDNDGEEVKGVEIVNM